MYHELSNLLTYFKILFFFFLNRNNDKKQLWNVWIQYIFSDMNVIIFILHTISFLVLNDNLSDGQKKPNQNQFCCVLILIMKYERDYNSMLSMRKHQ